MFVFLNLLYQITIYQFVNIILVFGMRYRRDIVLNTSRFFQKKKPSELRPAAMSTAGSKQPTHHPTAAPHTSSQSAVPRQTAKAPSSKPTAASHTGTRMGAAPTSTSPAGGWDDSGWGGEAAWGGDQWSSVDDTATGLSFLSWSFGYFRKITSIRDSHTSSLLQNTPGELNMLSDPVRNNVMIVIVKVL